MSSNWETNKINYLLFFSFINFCRVNSSGNELFNISLMLEKIKNILLALQIWDSRISAIMEIKIYLLSYCFQNLCNTCTSDENPFRYAF